MRMYSIWLVVKYLVLERIRHGRHVMYWVTRAYETQDYAPRVVFLALVRVKLELLDVQARCANFACFDSGCVCFDGDSGPSEAINRSVTRCPISLPSDAISNIQRACAAISFRAILCALEGTLAATVSAKSQFASWRYSGAFAFGLP